MTPKHKFYFHRYRIIKMYLLSGCRARVGRREKRNDTSIGDAEKTERKHIWANSVRSGITFYSAVTFIFISLGMKEKGEKSEPREGKSFENVCDCMQYHKTGHICCELRPEASCEISHVARKKMINKIDWKLGQMRRGRKRIANVCVRPCVRERLILCARTTNDEILSFLHCEIHTIKLYMLSSIKLRVYCG